MKKKLFLMIFSLLLVVGLAGVFWGTSIAEAASGVWDSCPRGEVNCAYPGQCHSYIDTNSDSICDRSQAAPVSSSTSTTGTSQVASDTDTIDTGASSTTGISTVDPETTGTTSNLPVNNYHFVIVLGGLVALYGLTWLLADKKVIKNLVHRKIWNLVLLVSALVSCLLGLVLTMNLDLGTNIQLPFNSLYWHVEAGIALAVVGIFHILWHWRYFAKIMGVNTGSKAALPAAVLTKVPGQEPEQS